MIIRPPIKQAYKLLAAANKDCPVRTGHLKASGQVEILSSDEVRVIYTADYGINVHENPKSRGFKWLEKNAIALEDQLVNEYADEVLRDMEMMK
jgi:hypothetical protein